MRGTMCVALALLQVITYIPSRSAKYVGGTVATIPQEVLGELDTSDQKVLSFEWAETKKTEGKTWRIAYSQVTGLSYGQHAGVAWGPLATGVATFGVGAVPFLFTKKRRHYLTIEFLDDKGKSQGAIFLVGKKAIGPLLDDLEAKTGKKTQYEDEEATRARAK